MPTPRENHDLTGCIACGSANPSGIGLRFRLDEAGRAVADTVCQAGWVSWKGIVHGGVLAMLMDEAAGWAVAGRGWTGLTARLSIRLARPVVPGQRLIVRAWVERLRKRFAQVAAELLTPGGTRVAGAQLLMFVTGDLPEKGIIP